MIYLLSCESNLIFDKASSLAASDEEETTTPLAVIASFVRRPFKFSNIKRRTFHVGISRSARSNRHYMNLLMQMALPSD